MADVRTIIARGRELTGRRLRDAIESATGKVMGGPGILVSTINGNTTVSLRRQAPPARGGGGIILGQVVAFSDPFNATYTIEGLPGSAGSLPDGTQLEIMVPQGRMFDTDAVDFNNAAVTSLVQIHPLPLRSDYAGPWYAPLTGFQGACFRDGECFPFSQGSCESTGGTFMGGACGAVYIAENVKISVCPDPQPGIVPPPQIIAQQELLT